MQFRVPSQSELSQLRETRSSSQDIKTKHNSLLQNTALLYAPIAFLHTLAAVRIAVGHTRSAARTALEG